MNEDKPVNNTIPTIHTLESDLASAVNDENYGKNIIKIVTDPKDNSTFNDNAVNDGGSNNIGNILTKKNIFIFAIIIFILASISVILYILNQVKNVPVDEVEIVATTTSTTIPVIKNKNFLNPEIIQASDFSKLNRNEIVSEINKIKKELSDKKIVANNNVEITTNITVEQFFEKIRYSGDDSLIRSFDDIYSFGIYSKGDGRFENYLLIKINSFDLAFKSILDWEKYIITDLKDIFIGNNEIFDAKTVGISTSTSVSVSTSTQISTSTIDKKYYVKDTNVFIDRILKNHDIREYVKNSENTHIIYGFINNKFLLITSGETSFINIKDRLLKENILR
jgi:hypothetical protein